MGIIIEYAYLLPDPDAFLPISAGCHGSVRRELDGGSLALRYRVPAFGTIMTVVGEEIEARQWAYLNQIQALLGDAREAAKASLRAIQMSEKQIEYLERKGTPSRFVRLKMPFDIAVDHVLPDGALFGPGDRLYSFTRWENRAFQLRLPRAVAEAVDLGMPARVTPTRWQGEPLRAVVTARREVGDGGQMWVTLKLAGRPTFPDEESCRIEIRASRLPQDHPPPVEQVVSPEDSGCRDRWGMTAEDRAMMKQRGGRGGIFARPEHKREQALQAAEREERRRTTPPLATMKPARKSRLRDTGLPRVELSEAEWKKAGIRTTRQRSIKVTPVVTADVLLSHDAAVLGLDAEFAASAAGRVIEALATVKSDGDSGAPPPPVLFASFLLPCAVAETVMSGGWLELAFTPATGERYRARGPVVAARCGLDGERRVRFGLALPAEGVRVEGRRKVQGVRLADPDGAREVLAVPHTCVRRAPDQAEDGPDRVILVHVGERSLAPVRVRLGLEGRDDVEIETAVLVGADEAIVYDLGVLDDEMLRFRAWEKQAAGAADRLRYRANLNRTDRRQ
ncbi:hypothetical protein J2X36_004555 [Methylobacterium sp. BE186]|uniref:hypothetical protein n=1 Tax=Methylobacterium sp. BE186 TaxID=2817715 RepID=UPI002856525D|nr:hypothetical protein [Methylobacterium sp. BE186]MDR7039777.1 hypothetical protein [Methylobacterium sp. BE186]